MVQMKYKRKIHWIEMLDYIGHVIVWIVGLIVIGYLISLFIWE